VCVCVDLQCACAILSYVTCPASLYFSKLFHKRKDFPKKLLNTKHLSVFSPQLLSGISLILIRIQRGTIKMYVAIHVTCRYSCQTLMKLEFPRQIFDNYSNINFHDRPVRAEFYPLDRQTDRRADRHDDNNSRFLQFSERT